MSQPIETGAAAAGADGPRDGHAAARLRDLLVLLGKTLRAYQVYQANNPVYERFLDGLRAGFAGVWEFVPALRFEVEEAGFRRDGQLYGPGEGRDSISFQFYKDGIRYLTFLPGFEDELERFLEVVVRARRLSAEEDDLVTLLWEQDFESFRYGYVDVLAEGLVLPESGEPGLEPIAQSALAADAASPDLRSGASKGGDAGAAAAPATINREDFKETLYFLEMDELGQLRQELENEWASDPKAEVLNALFDRLEDRVPERQTEILGILRQLLPVFLGRGDLVSAARILQEMEGILERGGLLGADQRALADALFDELSESTALGQLLQALEDGGIDPRSEELSLFLARLRPAALPVLFAATERSTSSVVRGRVQLAGDRLAGNHPGVVVELLASKDDAIATGAARASGRIRLTDAAAALIRLLDRPDAGIRLAAVDALVAMRSASAMDGLKRALEDSNREVRIAAVRGLGSLRYSPARGRLEEMINGRELRAADLTEKLACFEAYADLGGAEAVPVLDELLNGRGMLGRRQPAELRACAATALGRIGTPSARASLERAASETDTIVRGAVVRSLRKEVGAT